LTLERAELVVRLSALMQIACAAVTILSIRMLPALHGTL